MFGARTNRVRVHSFELWDAEGKLVAGELGTAVGGCYTALTGFSDRAVPSSGTIQMLATARILQASGFGFWDMGMPITYKEKLGSVTVPRAHFLSRLEEVRDSWLRQLRLLLRVKWMELRRRRLQTSWKNTRCSP
eukprot:TRINITY_DN10746_c0_g1_i7.p1 TRINITY_DN10746_c0_g1~~TRINITY_DN10746_c0_g1_i7.p1  ORF type:complete len:135 (+),score=20.21 TRINITY_DN10746_c0_g1_i7:138-542(+)